MEELGIMEAPEIEAEPVDQLDSSAEGTSSEPLTPETEVTETTESDDPYTTRFSREMRAALKAWEASNPDAAKFARQSRDNHARLFALQQLEPKGIDGVREKYALLDGLVRGEAKGPEALTAIQEELAAIEETDALLAAGDPKAFDSLGEGFNEGLAKLAPAYLERIQKTDPEAYERAIMPHLASTLASSELVQNYNRGVDELNWMLQNRPLTALQPEELSRFAARAMQILAGTGQGLNKIGEKGEAVKTPPPGTKPQDDLQTERQKLDQERQQIHWDTRIKPEVIAHENRKFEELLTPYQKRLKLDAGAKADLQQAFKAKMTSLGNSDTDYLRQMKLYRAQKNPDPSTVQNYVKNAINKHAKTAMESLVKARYSMFLNAPPKPQTPTNGNGKNLPPVSPNVEVRSVKPPMSEIDHQNTPVEWLAQRKYKLFSGKIVQVRPQA
jgi:hypothetical protein